MRLVRVLLGLVNAPCAEWRDRKGGTAGKGVWIYRIKCLYYMYDAYKGGMYIDNSISQNIG